MARNRSHARASRAARSADAGEEPDPSNAACRRRTDTDNARARGRSSFRATRSAARRTARSGSGAPRRTPVPRARTPAPEGCPRGRRPCRRDPRCPCHPPVSPASRSCTSATPGARAVRESCAPPDVRPSATTAAGGSAGCARRDRRSRPGTTAGTARRSRRGWPRRRRAPPCARTGSHSRGLSSARRAARSDPRPIPRDRGPERWRSIAPGVSRSRSRRRRSGPLPRTAVAPTGPAAGRSCRRRRSPSAGRSSPRSRWRCCRPCVTSCRSACCLGVTIPSPRSRVRSMRLFVRRMPRSPVLGQVLLDRSLTRRHPLVTTESTLPRTERGS